MPIIPDALKNLGEYVKYIRLREGKNNPEEKKWALDSKWTSWSGYSYDDLIIKEWIELGNNYGYRPVGDGICVFDCDDTLYDTKLIDLFKDTLTFRTGGGGYHFIFRSPGLTLNEKFILTAPDDTHLGHITTAGFKFQYVGPTCIHPNGSVYSVFKDVPVITIDSNIIMEHIKEYLKNTKIKNDKIKSSVPYEIRSGIGGKYTEILGLRVEDVCFPDGNVTQHGYEYRGSHPIHGSTTGNNFHINVNKNVWFCHRDKSGGDPFSFLAVKHGIISCGSSGAMCMDDHDIMEKTLHIIRIGGEGKYLSDKLIQFENEEKKQYFDNLNKGVDTTELLKTLRKQQPQIKDPIDSLPECVLKIPGVLQHVVDYYNRTATKKQPQFAVQTAIALGAIILGRRYFTNEQNGANLYLLNVAKSSAGKEHIKTVIEMILYECGFEKLIGPSSYTSAGAVMYWLMKKPNHITIMDEIGRDLESVSKASNSNSMDMITSLMKIYSKQTSIYTGIGYSDRNNRKKSETDDTETVRNPSITVCGITTPATFYGSITSSYVTNGFLPRFIICEAIYGRQPSRRRNTITWTIPTEIIEWCKKHQIQQEGNLPICATIPPNQVIIPISDAAYDMLDEYELEYMKLQDENEATGLDSMWGRCRENAMRLSLIAAISCDSNTIEVGHVEWAISYVRYYSEQVVTAISGNISDSPFEAILKNVYGIIKKAGDTGLTESDIIKKSRKMQSIEPKRRSEVFKSLIDSEQIILIDPDKTKPGKHSYRYVAI